MIALCDYNIDSIIFLEGCVMENQQQETVVESTPVVETVAEAPVVAKAPQKSALVIVFLIIASVMSLVAAFFYADFAMFTTSWPGFVLKLVGAILIMVGMGKVAKGATVGGAIVMAVAMGIEAIYPLYASIFGVWYMIPAALVAVAMLLQCIALVNVTKNSANEKAKKFAKIVFIIALVMGALRPVLFMVAEIELILVAMLMVVPHIFTIIALKKATDLR